MTHLVLIGFMASGKSTFAKRLHLCLNLPIFSTDDWIEAQSKMTISEIFSCGGEEAFREWEKKAYQEILKLEEKYIIDCGGGFVLHGGIQKLGRVYYLDTPLEDIGKRLRAEEKDKRPLSKSFKELYEKRKELYEKESLLKVKTIEEIVKDWKRISVPLP